MYAELGTRQRLKMLKKKGPFHAYASVELGELESVCQIVRGGHRKRRASTVPEIIRSVKVQLKILGDLGRKLRCRAWIAPTSS